MKPGETASVVSSRSEIALVQGHGTKELAASGRSWVPRQTFGPGLCVIFAIFSQSPNRIAAADRYDVVPSKWAPSFEQVQTYVDECAAAVAKNQRSLTQASRTRADLRDAQLFVTYVLLMQTLDGAERTELFIEQEKWLKKREELAQAAVVSKGGTLAPLEYSGTFRKITEDRLEKLEKRLNEQRAKSGASHRKRGE
jgi:uncharacterized protein YecT (DUF1311 family)